MLCNDELLLYNAAFNNRLSQSYIITAGADAEAENACSRFLLRLYCAHGIGCGGCPGCKKVLNDNHIDILTIKSEGAIKKEAVLPIGDFIAKKAYEGGYKCIVINNAHNMNETAQNLLLKSVEEPPGGVIFIFTTSAPEKLLLTIRSRSVTINIPRTPLDEVIRTLPDTPEAHACASQSGGSPSRALELYNSDAFKGARQAAFFIAEQLAKYKRPSVFKMSEAAAGCDTLALFTALSLVIRDALYISLGADRRYLYNPDKQDNIAALNALITDNGLLKMYDIINKMIEAKQLSPGINSASAIRAMLFEIMEVRNKCLK